MSRFPAIEALILRTLEEQGEMRPPGGRLAEEYFWLAASRLQARGLVVTDQRAGVVRRPEPLFPRRPIPEPPISEEEEEMLPEDSVGPFLVEEPFMREDVLGELS